MGHFLADFWQIFGPFLALFLALFWPFFWPFFWGIFGPFLAFLGVEAYFHPSLIHASITLKGCAAGRLFSFSVDLRSFLWPVFCESDYWPVMVPSRSFLWSSRILLGCLCEISVMMASALAVGLVDDVDCQVVVGLCVCDELWVIIFHSRFYCSRACE